MPRNLMNNLVGVGDVRSVLGIADYGMFYAPDSIEYIHDWITRHPADVQAHLWTALAMLVNFQEKQLRKLATTSNWVVRFKGATEKLVDVPVGTPSDGLRLIKMINSCRTLCHETGWTTDRVADDHQLDDLERQALDVFEDGVFVELLRSDEKMAEVDPDYIAWEYVEEDPAPPA